MNWNYSHTPKWILVAAAAILVLPVWGWAQMEEGITVLTPQVAKYDYDAIPKDPLASAFFSATIPGSGQIYNKEYLRGIVTGVGFYTSLLTMDYMLGRWEALNTDTFYIQGRDQVGSPTGFFHQVTAPKPGDSLVGLPTDEKVILGASVVATAGFYVWGIVDAYRGANRYNRKLFAALPPSVGVDVAFALPRKEARLAAVWRF